MNFLGLEMNGKVVKLFAEHSTFFSSSIYAEFGLFSLHLVSLQLVKRCLETVHQSLLKNGYKLVYFVKLSFYTSWFNTLSIWFDGCCLLEIINCQILHWNKCNINISLNCFGLSWWTSSCLNTGNESVMAFACTFNSLAVLCSMWLFRK